MFDISRRQRTASTKLRVVASIVAVPALVAGVAGATAPAASRAARFDGAAAATEQRLLGAWRLVSFEARTSGGQVLHPFGRDADGLLLYTRDGAVSATVWRAGRRPFASDDQQQGTPQEYEQAMRGYVQYTGTFSVDAAAGTVSHHIEQSVFPNWNGTTQTRFVTFDRDTGRLELTTPPTPFGGQTLVGALVWERLSP